MSGGQGADRRARVALSILADPGDLALGALLRATGPADILAAVSEGEADMDALAAEHSDVPGLRRALQRWHSRLGLLPTTARLAAWQDSGLRLILPGDSEWPPQLDDLGDARPLLLWARGADVALACANSVSVVGSRAATGYGQHVALELAAVLAEHGLVTVSGGAYGTETQLARTAYSSAAGRPVMPNSGRQPEHDYSLPACSFTLSDPQQLALQPQLVIMSA
jgi:DNA processing protein